MALQLILGNSGSGKSHLLYEKLIQSSMEHPRRNYMLIVPEQFTMQTQRDLVRMHPRHGILNLEVLSFRRLAHRIFEEIGSDRRTILTETGKNLMLRKVAMEQKEHLKLLGGRMNRPGYVSEVKSVLSELMQYEIQEEDLERLSEVTQNRPLLHAKLEDIRTLYGAFLRYQSDRFMKPEELMDVLCQMAGRSRLLKNSTLAFDGFTGFTPAQMNVLRELLRICPLLLITVTIDVRAPWTGEIQEHELFALSKKMIRKVEKAAQEAQKRGIQAQQEEPGRFFLPPILLGKEKTPRFRTGGALQHLEQNLFRKNRSSYPRRPEEISLHHLDTLEDEVHFAARTICALVREQGYRYQEIAVITGCLGAYEGYAKKIFAQYEVPVFLDSTRNILLNPCLEFVRGALAAAWENFSRETMFRFLRTGLAGFSAEELDRLENYVLAAGIRGRKKWETAWTFLPGSMTQEALDICNGCREKIAALLLPFARQMRKKAAPLKEYAVALYQLLDACQVQQKLKDRETALSLAGEREAAMEYAQIYRVLIALLEEMVDLMGEEKVSGREFGEILDAGLTEAKVGLVPSGVDQVQIGDITRSRLAGVKVLFFLGLNDGWVPSAEKGGALISDPERELLRENGVELAASARENSYIQRFYLYQNLTKPSERLYLSWCASRDGTAMRPSYLVQVLLRLFPNLAVCKERPAGTALSQVTSRENGLLYFTMGLQRIREGSEDPAWMELYRSYLEEDAYRTRVQRLVAAAFGPPKTGSLTFLTARALYGEQMTGSVTRLEQFAACAFAHFAAYGLRLSERELYGVKPVDLGVLFHRALELFSRRLQQEGLSWRDLSKEQQTSLMEACVEEVTGNYESGALTEDARQAYTICRLRRILCRTVWALHEQLKAGEFLPVGFEVSFADAGDLDAVQVRFGTNGHIRLQGRIDRIDTAQTEDTVYVKIVDYKSGLTKFEPVSMYYGLQLQLLVYLNAALEMEQRLHPKQTVRPAGVFYYHLEDPVLERETQMGEEALKEELLKKLRPDGIVNANPEVIDLLDRNLTGDSLVIPAGRKKDGSLKAASSAVSTRQFAQLSVFAAKKMKEMAGRILEGEVAPAPYADQNQDACAFCLFADVCGLDPKIPGLCKKRTPQLTKEEVWEQIEKECPLEESNADGKDGENDGNKMDQGTAARH